MEIIKYGYRFRTVEEWDAEFILSLRGDEQLSRFLSPTDNSLEKQKQWIAKYKERETRNEEFYFLMLDANAKPLGVARIYNFEQHSFESGSWLFSRSAPNGAAILGDLMSRDHGFEELGFEKCRFNVRKNNKTVVNYALSFKPELVDEDELNLFFEMNYITYKKQRDRYLRMLVK